MTMKTNTRKPGDPAGSPAARAGGRSPTAVVPDRWWWHYQVLQELRDRLIDDRDAQREQAREALEPHSMDFADSGTDEFDHDLALALLSQHQDALLEVGAAMRRILDGTYGVCEETGEPIPDERLRAVPWTRHTREVEARLEKAGLAHPARFPAVASIQGEGPGGLVQVEDPELEYGQAREVARQKRDEAAEAIEQGADEPEERFPAPIPVEEETQP